MTQKFKDPIVRIYSYNNKCRCGRSLTGYCIGWHALTEEEYKDKLKEQKWYKAGELKEKK
jgi:CDGSH-type Zn-finger protein